MPFLSLDVLAIELEGPVAHITPGSQVDGRVVVARAAPKSVGGVERLSKLRHPLADVGDLAADVGRRFAECAHS